VFVLISDSKVHQETHINQTDIINTIIDFVYIFVFTGTPDKTEPISDYIFFAYLLVCKKELHPKDKKHDCPTIRIHCGT